MKNCPKCGAQIDDNARFCMYCMTSLEEKTAVDNNTKNRSAHMIVIAVLLVLTVLFVILCFAFCGKGGKKDNEKYDSFPAVNSDFEDYLDGDEPTPDYSDKETATSSKPKQDDTTTSAPILSGSSSDDSGSKASSKAQGSSSRESSKASPSSKTSSTKPSSTVSPTSSTDKVSSNVSSNTSSNAATSGYPAATASYTYRDAVNTDDEIINSTKLLGGVTITGVSEKAPNGVYVIPEYLGGKKVVAVAKNAFNAGEIKDTVKVVVFPKTMLNVNAYSFSSCYDITDIYFAGEKTYIAGDAFPRADKRNWIITLHSSNTAENRNHTKLENFAVLYHNMLFSTWNGGAID